MAIDVHEPSLGDYSTKPTSQVSTPQCGDYQHNNNQTSPTITTKDKNFDILLQKIAADRLEADRRWEEEKARRLEEEVAREAEYVTKRAQ
eukprot:CAMPEP_0170950014 /NCGR_PEP_ID=MMETSP0735-20130129/29661_1 /TAXON_ID=186038 /ORGANISM="Fragilariopsis kerguelensis, Strain L26-C5" /LENGTH=89 /DNA_ID=CAMNT_0011360273 /DNA_START=8 /DNA_END=274 /DNA_ORIENTATION=+